jgi:rRNA maturation endonuclease Nob1
MKASSPPRNVLLDTNILLLLVIGSYDRSLLGSHKRVAKFTDDDFDLLDQIVRRVNSLVTTPHVLTETSNLASHIGEPHRGKVLNMFAEKITLLAERREAAQTLAQDSLFTRLGLTDAGILHLVDDTVLLTDDYRLTNTAIERGLNAVNFNHFRTFRV